MSSHHPWPSLTKTLCCTCNPYYTFFCSPGAIQGSCVSGGKGLGNSNESARLREGGKCLFSLLGTAHGFRFHSIVQYLLKVYCMPNSARCQEHHSKPLYCCMFIGPLEQASVGQTKKKYNDTKQFI